MRTLEEIDRFIRARAATITPGNIASRLNMRVSFIHARMDVMGIEHDGSDHTNKYSVHPMWDKADDELRFAIWRRQHDGAAATLAGRA